MSKQIPSQPSDRSATTRDVALPASDPDPVADAPARPPRITYRSLATLLRRLRPLRGRLLLSVEEHVHHSHDQYPGAEVRLIGGRPRIVLAAGGPVFDAAATNLDLLVDAFAADDVPHFVIAEPGATRHRVGVADMHWDRALHAIGALGDTTPIYLGVVGRNRRGRRRRHELVTEPSIVPAAQERDRIEVFCYLAVDSGTQIYGRDSACLVERWHTDEVGGLQPPSRNALAGYIGQEYQRPAVLEVAGRPRMTLEPLARRNAMSVDFPVDVVYMWVDGEDPTWLEKKVRAAQDAGPQLSRLAAADFRFRQHDELRYSLRSLEANAPWVRRVYLVTDDQVPPWLDTSHPSLRLVDHRELFGATGRLPTFNSHAIAARLHHLPGLSEHYLILNDDIFFGRPVQPQLFFLSNGQSLFHMSRSSLPWTDPEVTPPHEMARRNVVDLLRAEFGRTVTRTFFHSPAPQRRSVLVELEQRFPEAFSTTWESQFRSSSDFEVNQWLHHYYAYLTGRATPGQIAYAYFDVTVNRSWKRMGRTLRRRNFDAFCLNDIEDAPEDLRRARITDWLATYFPRPSAFELPTPRADEAWSAVLDNDQAPRSAT